MAVDVGQRKLFSGKKPCSPGISGEIHEILAVAC